MFLARKKRSKLAVVPYRNHDVYKWKIAGLYQSGKRVRRFFEKKAEAETFVRQLEIKAENLGNRALHIDPRLHVMAIECYDRLAPYGKTIADAAEFYCQHLEAVKRSCTVKEVFAEFLQAKKAEDAGKRYMEDLCHRLGRFQKAFGTRTLATISQKECTAWIRALGGAKQTRTNYRRVLSVFFNYAVAEEFAVENPIEKIKRTGIVKVKPPEVLTPLQTSRLLAAATPDVLPYFAIGAFAGIRAAEISRLNWREIHLDRNFIEVTAGKSKTATRRLVTILPNLKAWLAPLTRTEGAILPRNPRVKMEAARKLAGIKKWPHNGLRHSFASYHVAKFQDAAALALQLGHMTTKMLFEHYREVVTPDAAQKYWALFPPSSTSASGSL